MAQRKTQLESGLKTTEYTASQKKGITDSATAYVEGLAAGSKRKIDAAVLKSAAALNIFIAVISQECSGTKYSESEKKKIVNGLSDIIELMSKVLHSAEMVIVAARLMRIIEIQRVFGSLLMDAIAIKIEKSPASFGKEIPLYIQKLPISEQLDVIHQLATINSKLSMRAISQSLERRSVDEIIIHAQSRALVASYEPAVNALGSTEDYMKGVVHAIRKRIQFPLIHYACSELQASIDERKAAFLATRTGDEIFSNGVSYGDPTEGRQIEKAPEEWFMEDIHLRDRIIVPMEPSHLPTESRRLLARTALDAVAIYDHTMIPQSIAQVDFESLPESRGPSLAFSSAILQNREVLEIALTQSLSKSILHFFPLFIIDQSPDRLAEVVAAQSTVMTRDEWIRYFSLWKILLNETDSPDANKEQATIELILIDKRLEPKKETLIRELFLSAQQVLDASPAKSSAIEFRGFESVQSSAELNPFFGTEEENIPLLLQHLYRPAIRRAIEQDLGISLEDIPLRSQIHFLRFLASADRKTFKRFSQIMKQADTWKYEFLDAFMTASDQPSFGNVLLNVAERIGSDRYLGKNLFHRISMITRASADVSEYLRTTFHTHADQKKVRACIQHLMRRAQTILHAADTKTRDELLEISMDLPSEIVLFTAAFKALRESGEMPQLSEIEEVEFSIIKGDELRTFLSDKIDTEEMEWIYMSQYTDPKYTPQFKEALMERFHSAIQSEHTTLYVIKHMGLVVAFCRFDRQDDGNLYFGSFVVSKHYENNKLGMALLEESLLKLGKTQKIEADCDPDSPAAKMYEKLGFVVTKRYDYHGVPSTHIVREPDNVRLRIQSAA